MSGTGSLMAVLSMRILIALENSSAESRSGNAGENVPTSRLCMKTIQDVMGSFIDVVEVKRLLRCKRFRAIVRLGRQLIQMGPAL